MWWCFRGIILFQEVCGDEDQEVPGFYVRGEDCKNGWTCIWFDDSPLKVRQRQVISEPTDDVHIMQSLPIDRELVVYIPLKIGETLVCMKRLGSGTKPPKSWMRELMYEEDNDSHPSTKFWKEQYKVWRIYDYCNPKLLATSDVMETLQMRLSFHLQDKALMKQMVEASVDFDPLKLQEDGTSSVSYASIVWYLSRLRKGEEQSSEATWCEYCMGFAEQAYIQEVIAMGCPLVRSSINGTVRKVLREELIMYFTKLRAETTRNESAHIFSTALEQWQPRSTWVAPKVRCLLDKPVTTLSANWREKLQNMLKDLANLELPGGLGVLKHAFPMQICFLKHVLEHQSPKMELEIARKKRHLLPPLN